MKYQDIRVMAKAMGINTFGMGKTTLIRSIQQTENSISCYGTRRVEICGEMACLWREECLLANESA